MFDNGRKTSYSNTALVSILMRRNNPPNSRVVSGGYLYLLVNKETKNIKIGHSITPRSRIGTLRGDYNLYRSNSEWKMLEAHPFIESYLHDYFKEIRVPVKTEKGKFSCEWYSLMGEGFYKTNKMLGKNLEKLLNDFSNETVKSFLPNLKIFDGLLIKV